VFNTATAFVFLDKFLFEVVLFLYQKEKERKRSWQACGLTACANGRRITQSPMKLRALRSSVLCGNPYPVRAFASRGCADGASVSPTPSSFPSFICLQIPCSTSRTVTPINSCLQVSFFFTKKKKNEKEVGNLRQVDRLCERQAHHAKPDETPRTAFIGSLLESISRPSFRFAKVR